MGGLWKLTAMSAVIGAGLVVVWQAQASFEAPGELAIPLAPRLEGGEFTSGEADPATSPTELATTEPAGAGHASAATLIPPRARATSVATPSISPENHSAADHSTTARSSTGKTGDADSPTLLEPETAVADADEGPTLIAMANASVPPEENVGPTLTVPTATAQLPTAAAEVSPTPTLITPASPTEPGKSAPAGLPKGVVPNRYSRGLDFRRQPHGAAAAASVTAATPAAATDSEPGLLPGLPLPSQGDVINQDMIQPAGDIANASGVRSAMATDQEPGIAKIPDADDDGPEPLRLPGGSPLESFRAESNIQLTAGEQPASRVPALPTELPDNDPFFDAAPPALGTAAPAAAPKSASPATAPGSRPALPTEVNDFDPFGEAPATNPAPAPAAAPAVDPFESSMPTLPERTPPARTPAPALPTDVEDPFGNEPAPRAMPAESPTPAAPERAAAPTALPTDLDSFNPLPANSPAPAAAPERTPPSRAATPLPLEIDEPAPNRPTLPAEPAFDPFSDEPPARTPPARTPPARTAAPVEPSAPSAMPEPARNPAPVTPEAAPENSPAPERSPPSRMPVSREPAAPSANDASLFQGDGEVRHDAPRGVQEPRLTIEKFAPSSAILGQPLIYSVLVKNVGGSAASQVTVEDRIPKGTRLVGTAPQAEMIDKRLVWRKLGTLQPGEERKISIKVIPEEAGPIGSVAKVSFISEVAAEIVVQAPQLKVSVNIPPEAKIGTVVPMVFSISNPGNGEASNVILRSVIPEGLQHPAGNDLEYTVGKLAPKETREVRLEVTAMKPGRLTHQTIVTGDGNLSVESRDTVEVVGEQLLLTRSGHDRVYLGRNATFTNTVTNEGKRPVSDVKLVEAIPAGFEFVSADQGGQYSAADRSVTWQLGTLPPAGSAAVSVTLVAKSIGRFDATVTASGPGGSVATVRPDVAIDGYPALALERLGQERLVGVGESLTTKIQLQNKGSGSAGHVGLTIDLPTELKLVSASGPSSYRRDGQRLIFEPIDQLESRGSVAYELVLEAQTPGDSRLEMQISADHLRRPVRHDEAVQILPALRPGQ